MESNQDKIKEYNNIPVYYCERCLSLLIRNIPNIENSDYCDDCGSTDIRTTHIENWQSKYKAVHGFDYLDSDYNKHIIKSYNYGRKSIK